jgi:glycosyltransferase involved in cell wall biosynthesis
MPAHDEAARVAASVRAALGVAGVDEVVMVDDGSSDDTSGEARRADARVVTLERNVGKGAALNAGLAVVDSGLGALLLLDADLGDSASEASLLLGPVLAGAADMTIARFPPTARPGGFGLVKGLARAGISWLGGDFQAEAPLSGQRALSPRAVEALTPFAEGFGVEVTLTVRALRRGFVVTEVPTEMTHAATGRDAAGFLHRGRQFVDVLRSLAALRRE